MAKKPKKRDPRGRKKVGTLVIPKALQAQAVAKLPHPSGRPTDYRIEYCDELIKHCAKGLSYESFAGAISVSRQTLYQWEQDHKEFSDAKKVARDKQRLQLETVGLMQATGKMKGAPGPWIFFMKNCCGWTDNPEFTSDYEGVDFDMEIDGEEE